MTAEDIKPGYAKRAVDEIEWAADLINSVEGMSSVRVEEIRLDIELKKKELVDYVTKLERYFSQANATINQYKKMI